MVSPQRINNNPLSLSVLEAGLLHHNGILPDFLPCRRPLHINYPKMFDSDRRRKDRTPTMPRCKGCDYEADINPGMMPKNGSLPSLAQGGTASALIR